MTPYLGRVLVVDDTRINRTLLMTHLREAGHTAECANDGAEALRMLRQEAFDVVFLDLVMPNMSGYDVLAQLQSDPELRHLPVIVVSSIEDTDSVVHCIGMGATDYLFKPFNPVLVNARLSASLARKRLYDLQEQHTRQIELEQQKTESILFNILPRAVAERLKRGEREIVEHYPDASVLFADLVGFTTLAATCAPTQLLFTLNTIFSAFDELVTQSGLEKVKTIGDEYMVVGGVPAERADHAAAVTRLGLDMLDALERLNTSLARPMQLRVGIHSGSLVAGVLGSHKFAFDLWGDTVNTAHRLQTSGEPGHLIISEATLARLEGAAFAVTSRGLTPLKGREPLETFLVAAA